MFQSLHSFSSVYKFERDAIDHPQYGSKNGSQLSSSCTERTANEAAAPLLLYSSLYLSTFRHVSTIRSHFIIIIPKREI